MNLHFYIFRAIKQEPESPSKPETKKVTMDADWTLENKIEEQNIEYFKLRDDLKTNSNQSVWTTILEANNQYVPSDPIEVIYCR